MSAESNVQTGAGVTFAISAGLPSTNDQAGYEALTFTQVGEVTNNGEIGREYAPVTHSPVSSRADQILKGNFKDRPQTITFGRDFSDAGQILLAAALDSDSDYSINVTLQDGTEQYYRGKVMNLVTTIGTGSDVVGGTVTIEPNSDCGVITVTP